MATRVPPIYETNKVPNPNDVNNPGFPISCTHQEQNADGTSPNTPPFGGGDTPITIGTVTVAGNAAPTVGDTVTYTASRSGNSADTVFTFSAPGETFTGGAVTWASDGATTVTCTATSATATDSGATGTLAVTVAAAPAPAPTLTLSSTDFTNGALMPACSGQSLTNVCGGGPLSPQLTWTLANDPGTITEWRLLVTDNDAGGFVHWNVTDIPVGTTSIAQETNPTNNGWPAAAQIGDTGSGAVPGGGQFENGFEGFAPPSGTHTYSWVVTGHAADGSTVVTSTAFTGTFQA
jgi:phosphatidylethanolamine-binding protein (PEBP) family uncharacterized protein